MLRIFLAGLESFAAFALHKHGRAEAAEAVDLYCSALIPASFLAINCFYVVTGWVGCVRGREGGRERGGEGG